MPRLKINQVLLNRYRVDEFIGGGGPGLVYKVRDLEMNTDLAMKVLNMDPELDSISATLFRREAKAYSALAHPNIVRYFGIEKYDDVYFMLLDYIDGDSLANILAKPGNRPFPGLETLVVYKAVCSALGYAHMNSVVHCDIKPGNILVDKGGKVYLTDFGIARHMESTATDIGSAGTIAYMAPEQFRQEPVNAATDVYALGIVLFEMLVGQKPFRPTDKSTSGHSRTSRELLEEAHLSEEPPYPTKLRPEIPQAVSQVILKSLQKDPSKRYQSTGELFSALCLACGVRKEDVKDRISQKYVTGGSPPPPPRPPTDPRQPHESKQYRHPPIWFFALCFLVVTGVILYLVLSPPPPPLPPPAATQTSPLPLPSPTYTVINEPPFGTATNIPTIPNPKKTNTSPVSTDGMRMIYIPEGEFVMGSRNCSNARTYECPSHSVYLDSYWIDETEVTNEMYRKCETDRVCVPPKTQSSASHSYYYGNSQFSDYPVIYVDWYQANDYCQYVGKRLPSEAEWEKAARGDLEYSYPWGDIFQCDYGNFDDDRVFDGDFVPGGPDCDGYTDTSPVGSYPGGESPYKVLDLSGNVWEWVQDYYGYYDRSDDYNPSGPRSGIEVVLRGGSWTNDMDLARTTFRAHNEKTFVNNDIGFRCVKDD